MPHIRGCIRLTHEYKRTSQGFSVPPIALGVGWLGRVALIPREAGHCADEPEALLFVCNASAEPIRANGVQGCIDQHGICPLHIASLEQCISQKSVPLPMVFAGGYQQWSACTPDLSAHSDSTNCFQRPGAAIQGIMRVLSDG
jgi:hypothetical protein